MNERTCHNRKSLTFNPARSDEDVEWGAVAERREEVGFDVFLRDVDVLRVEG